MQSNGVDFTAEMDKDVQVFEESGQTVVMVAVDGMYVTCNHTMRLFVRGMDRWEESWIGGKGHG